MTSGTLTLDSTCLFFWSAPGSLYQERAGGTTRDAPATPSSAPKSTKIRIVFTRSGENGIDRPLLCRGRLTRRHRGGGGHSERVHGLLRFRPLPCPFPWEASSSPRAR